MKKKVICANCTKEFEKENSEIKRSKNHFCTRSCAAVYNNKKYPKKPNTRPRRMLCCKYCNNELPGKHWINRQYCSWECQGKYQYKTYVERWFAGKETGNVGSGRGLGISAYVRKWLFEQHDNKCEKCGWNKVHSITNKIPLQVEHIDGHSENTVPENLELLCPNCHSLTPTFMALNIGNGRGARQLGE